MSIQVYISYPTADSDLDFEMMDTREIPVVGTKVESVDGPRYTTGWSAPTNYLSERPETAAEKAARPVATKESWLDNDLVFGAALGACAASCLLMGSTLAFCLLFVN